MSPQAPPPPQNNAYVHMYVHVYVTVIMHGYFKRC